jgi:hypothetical protein
MEKFLQIVPADCFSIQTLGNFFELLANLIGGPHFQLSQKAVRIVMSGYMINLMNRDPGLIIRVLFTPLFQNLKFHWHKYEKKKIFFFKIFFFFKQRNSNCDISRASRIENYVFQHICRFFTGT